MINKLVSLLVVKHQVRIMLYENDKYLIIGNFENILEFTSISFEYSVSKQYDLSRFQSNSQIVGQFESAKLLERKERVILVNYKRYKILYIA